jgi:hypothetical protein
MMGDMTGMGPGAPAAPVGMGSPDRPRRLTASIGSMAASVPGISPLMSQAVGSGINIMMDAPG